MHRKGAEHADPAGERPTCHRRMTMRGEGRPRAPGREPFAFSGLSSSSLPAGTDVFRQNVVNVAHPARIRIRIRIGIRIRWLRVRFVRQIFVDGQIPSQTHGASIRPSNTRQAFIHVVPSQNHAASICPRMNTLSKTWGNCLYTDECPPCKTWESIRLDEYPRKNMGQAVVRGRVTTVSETWGQYTLMFEHSTNFTFKLK